jgi:hypothetical protein
MHVSPERWATAWSNHRTCSKKRDIPCALPVSTTSTPLAACSTISIESSVNLLLHHRRWPTLFRSLFDGNDILVLLAGDGPDGVAVLRFRMSIWSSGFECYLAEQSFLSIADSESDGAHECSNA